MIGHRTSQGELLLLNSKDPEAFPIAANRDD
jgi:hypothetical protein